MHRSMASSAFIRRTVRIERQVKLRVVGEAVRIRQVDLYYLKELGGVDHKQKRAETAALWDTKRQLVKNRKSKESSQIKPSSTISPITVTELRDAEHAILSYVQRQFFKQEYEGLKSTVQPNASKHKLLKSSSIHKLDPVLIQGFL